VGGVTFSAKRDPAPIPLFIAISMHWATSSVGSMFGAYSQASALNLDWSFLTRLKEPGYQAAEQWQASIPRH
jgi:hypothetical protein